MKQAMNQAQESAPILIIGSTGKTGRRIAQRLEAQGHLVRHGSRQSDPAFDWEQPGTWAPALEGVQAAYISFFPDLAVPGAPDAIEALAQRAEEAGVQRLVLLSGRGEVNAQRCEEIVASCGLDYTLLRASWFSQNFSEGHLVQPVLDGVIAMPAGDVREPFVDVDDIAEVAVAALTANADDNPHAGHLYELTGPRLLSWADVAAELSAAAGYEIAYLPITLEQFHEALAADAGAEYADMLTNLCREVFDGRNEYLADGVHQALGRHARDFADFANATAATGVWATAGACHVSPEAAQ
jgi:uncharacterized protein YbjT (DUF2867 family)